MSRVADYTWRIEQERRRQAYLSRIRATTSGFVDRYEEILARLRAQCMSQYVPQEFARLERKVSELRRLLSDDPERARDQSMTISMEIHGLPHLARDAQRHALEHEQRRRQALSDAIRTMLDQAFGIITDPVEREFAYAAAEDLRGEFSKSQDDANALERVAQELKTRLSAVQDQARQRAADWKAARQQVSRAEVQLEVLQEARQAVVPDMVTRPDALRKLTAAWNALSEIAKTSADDFNDALATAAQQADDAVVDEECRRSAVRAVYESLQRAGFVVASPRKASGETDEVVLLARKPAGAQAEFRINGTGGLSYKFDHYEGSACKKDIDQVLPMLEKIYGIKLSDERVRWENPDRLSRDARPLGDTEAENG